MAWRETHLDRQTLPGRTIRVHAGDMVGASPLISSWFHDEPTVAAAAIGFDVGTLGNHEFDEGATSCCACCRAAAAQAGGTQARRRRPPGQHLGPGFAASFPTIAANTFDRSGRLVLPPYRVVERAGVRIGFIGATTAAHLAAQAPPRFRFGDVSQEVNRWVPVLRAQGVEAIVVLAHRGPRARTRSIPRDRS